MSSESQAVEPNNDQENSTRPKRRRMGRRILFVFVAILIVLQLVPYGRSHANPSVTYTVKWDKPETEALARRACFDCHSNETQWPWYSNVAPASWLVQHDVDEGRRELNFSDGNLGEIDEAGGLIQSGEMPLWYYRFMHSSSRLSKGEQDQLMEGLTNTFKLADVEGHDSD